MTLEKALALETKMWESAKNRNADGFLEIVHPEAVMVCGGYRCTGKENAEIIRSFDCKSYHMDGFEIVHDGGSSFQVHYILKMEVEDTRNKDLEGSFHITTTWTCGSGSWKVVFNMDQRIA